MKRLFLEKVGKVLGIVAVIISLAMSYGSAISRISKVETKQAEHDRQEGIERGYLDEKFKDLKDDIGEIKELLTK